MYCSSLILIILLNSCLVATTSDESGDMGEVNGPVVDNGNTGVGDTERLNQQEQDNQELANETAELYSEGTLLEQQDAYEAWLEVCVLSTNIPLRNEQVKQFLLYNGMTEEDLLDECEKKRASMDSGNIGRRMINQNAGVWDKCIVPYKFDQSLLEVQKIAVTQVHNAFEKLTGFRFVEYNNTNSAMGLGHNNYLNYLKGEKCIAIIGNQRWNGQNISPCNSFGVAIHEVGHALGFRHEHQDPASYPMMKPNFDNIDPAVYTKYSIRPLKDVHGQEHFYDLTSAMHYGGWDNRKGYGRMMTADEPELSALIGTKDYFYMFRDLQQYHNCYAEYSSCDTLPVCLRGGYPSVVDGVCTCACPEGLDPVTSCATVRPLEQIKGSWPAGTFTLLRVKDAACPAGTKEGQMTRWNYKGTKKGGDFHSSGYKNKIEFTHNVCTKTTSLGSGEWPAGSYCFLKRGDCPSGFEEGLMETFGREPYRSNYATGALPDGNKGQDFEYQFCCRNDGYWKIPISVPNTEPFIWYAKDKQGCQQVNGMHVFREYYHIKSNTAGGTLSFTGSLPYHQAWSTGNFYTYYCVYCPISTDETYSEVKTFSAGDGPYTISTPNYPNYYPLNAECLWHFESPTGTTMRLDFTDFEVSTVADPDCKSFVELKTYKPGMTGFRICGHHEKKSRLSVENHLTIKFASSVNIQQKGFTATVTVLSDTDKCYTGSGTDHTYAGTVDYSQSMKACLPWSQVTNCALNQFSYSTQDIDLSHNYCRTVVTGRKPWCYVNAELCYRENCDACMRDACYDVLPNCETIIQEDGQFCTNDNLGEASRGCRSTCGFCNSHAQLASHTTVTCSSPGNVTDISPSPMKSSYNVGEVVQYKCFTSSTVRTRTCRGDGTWTHLGYVCSGCPTGWSYIRGRCYQWQGPEVTLKYNDAKNLCQTLDGTVAVVESKEQLNGVLGLTNYDKLSNPTMWFALKSNDVRRWAWEDGTEITYTGFEAGLPTRAIGCVEGSSHGTWMTTSCFYEYDVVCSKNPKGTFECEDDLPNCADILERTPDLCEVYPDYAWANCRKTCRVTGCLTAKESCSYVDNAHQIHGSSTLDPGQYVEYRCNGGFFQTSGNLKRACLPSGRLTGSQLVCSDREDVSNITLFSEVELFHRESYADLKFPVVADIDSTRITVAGKITAWTFFSSEAGEVSMLLWRPNPLSATEFTLIGKNTLSVTADKRAVTMEISAGDQITAQVGDVFGLHMVEPVITYNKCKSTALPQYTTWMRGTSRQRASTLMVNKAYTFVKSSNSCRVYSIHVTIAPNTAESRDT